MRIAHRHAHKYKYDNAERSRCIKSLCLLICINIYFILPVRRLWPLGHTAGDLSLWPFGHTRQNNRMFHKTTEKNYGQMAAVHIAGNRDSTPGIPDKTGIELMDVCGIRPHVTLLSKCRTQLVVFPRYFPVRSQ
jgi:hypothetical protein